MKSKIYLVIIMNFIFIFSGCSSKDLASPNINTLENAKYELDNDNNLILKKEYKIKKENETQSIIKTDNISKEIDTFEKIPNFEKKYSKDIKFKKRKREKEKIELSGENIKVSVEDIPLNEFIDLFFSNIAKLNYTVTKDVKKLDSPVTLNMAYSQPISEAFEVVSKILSMNNVIVKKENDIFFISKKNGKKITENKESLYIGYGREVREDIPDDEIILMFVPYNHIPPKKSVYILQQSGIKKSRYYYPAKNVQMIKDTAGVVRKTLEIIKLIDRPFLEGKTPYLVDFKNIEVNKFVRNMTSIFKSNGILVTNIPSQGGILMNPIEDINSLLVITPKQSWMDMLIYWKNKLDIKSEMTIEPHFYTYKVKNRKADELAEAINSIINIKLAGTKVETKKATKKTKTSVNKNNSKKITADLPTNTLMMQLLPSEYRELLPLIEQLDALPLQVLAEVTLAEVTLTDSFSLGFEHTIRNNKELISKPFSSTSGALGATIKSTGFAATYQANNIQSVLSMAAEKKLLNILSKPKILILNNESGKINVGSQVPVITGETNSEDLSATTRSVSYRNTGITVSLTPTINSNGILTMKVSLNLSEAQLNETSSIDSPIIVNRVLDTSLTMKSDDTILLGGLISKNESTTDKGVPYLMDIPWLGSLFKYKSTTTTKTELIMLIKPSIINSQSEINLKTKKYKKMLKLLSNYSLL